MDKKSFQKIIEVQVRIGIERYRCSIMIIDEPEYYITYSFRCNWIFVKIEISDGSKIASECSLPHSALQAGRSGAATILILRST